MNFKVWLVLFIIIILAVVLFAGIFATKDKSVNFDGKNEHKYMKIESDIFVNDGKIPALYTCDGNGTQPPLKISGVPKEAKSLALIVDDPDAPSGDFVHWVVWNIDPKISVIENGKVPNAIEGYTSLNKMGWVAPCPPSGVHHYNFKLYALNTDLSIPRFSSKMDLLRAMDRHILDSATLVGLYGRGK